MPSLEWTKLGQDIDGYNTDDESGYSVSLSADGLTVAIGAPYNNEQIGNVKVYRFSNNVWIQLGEDIYGEDVGDQSGYSVSLSADGSIVAIGARYNSGLYNSGDDVGHVRVYRFSNNAWIQLGQDINGEAVNDESGRSVSLSADGLTVAIGAAYNDGINGTSKGHVRVYRFINNTWTQLGQDIDGEADNDYSGWSVSLSADGLKVAIGSTHNDGSGNNAGHVRVYGFSNNVWSQLGQDINGETLQDQSGFSVSLSADGSIVAIGAPTNNSNGNSDAGHVRVYGFSNNAWTQLGQDIGGEAADDQSGRSVSLSADGLKVAIGAAYNDGSGNDAGHVRVYGFSNNVWTQIGQDIDGEAMYDESGVVSLSADGSKVAIGAPNVSDYTGRVRVYELPIPNSDICFVAGTPIQTNQGLIPIEQINPDIHTIRNKPIVGITQIVYAKDKYLVSFEKDCLGNNIPSQKTIVSMNHKIFYNGKMMEADRFVGKIKNVKLIDYKGEILYNVLMEEHDKMVVNNMICETLDPKNDIAKLYKMCKNISKEEQRDLIEWYNYEYRKKHKIQKK
jgi:hypothetical protein